MADKKLATQLNEKNQQIQSNSAIVARDIKNELDLIKCRLINK